MKLNCWILFGAMLSTSLLAQPVADAPPSAPLGTAAPAASTNAAAGASATNAAAPKATSKKKTAAKKKKEPAVELKTVPLVPGPAIVAANHVNVRGQAKLNSEVVTRLTNGQPVMVIEEITRNNSGPDEPSAWAKIQLPPGAHTWINTTYLDENKAVKPKKLNLRAGPGENYSVLGQLQGGEIVNPVNTKGGWSEIEPPTNAYAFVAAQYLKQEAPGALASAPATTATVAEAPAIAAATTDTSTTNAAETAVTTNAVADATTADATSTAPATEEPPPKRIVQREGMVRGTFSIQAPTHFELISPENGKTIDYLYTTAPSLDLRRYKGLRIIVTGEEGIEERWGNTPMLTIQKIQVLE